LKFAIFKQKEIIIKQKIALISLTY